MACSKAISLNIASEGDVPIDMAIYVSGIDKIIGCRGKWIHKFSATTGELEASMRWCTGLINESYITAIGNDVYVCGWRGVVESFGTFPYQRPNRSVFKINVTTMTVTSELTALNTQAGIESLSDFYTGWRNLVSNGTNLYGFTGQGFFWMADPTNIAPTYDPFRTGYQTVPLFDMCYTAAESGLILIASSKPSESCIIAAWADDGDTNCQSTPYDPASDPTFYGVTYSDVNSKGYAVGMDATLTTPVLIKLNINEIAAPAFNDFTYTELNILDAAANPIRIKYSTYTNLLYIPEWSNDKVQIVDPSSDTVVATRTGFSDPIDIVCTPTKTWAVQNSAVGLLEIEEP